MWTLRIFSNDHCSRLEDKVIKSARTKMQLEESKRGWLVSGACALLFFRTILPFHTGVIQTVIKRKVCEKTGLPDSNTCSLLH